MKPRVYFLDNLRTFLIFLVVVLHAGIVYEPILENVWIVSDPEKLGSIGLIRMYLDIFIMFGMFFISGYFVRESLKKNNPAGFILSKFKRIMLPWIVAVLTLIPIYKGIFLYSRGLPQDAWYTYFHFFQRVGSDLSDFGNNPTQSWLWFLPVLFMFQLVYLMMSKTKLLSLKINLGTAVSLTLFIGVIYSMLVSRSGLTGWHHSALLHFQRERLLVYFMVFLLGSLCHKLDLFAPGKLPSKKHYIISNVVLTLSLSAFTVISLNLFYNMIEPGREYYFVSPLVDRLAYYNTQYLSMLSFIHIFIYTFQVYFNWTNGLMSQLSGSSYPVYIIHMMVLGLFALPLTHVYMPVMAKYLILVVLTYSGSNFLVFVYQGFLRKRFTLRVLGTGMLVIGFFVLIQPGCAHRAEPAGNTDSIARVRVLIPDMGLHEAIIKGENKIVHQHIAAGSGLDTREKNGGSTPLMTAALLGNTEAAVALNAGASLNLQNYDGSTALHTAAFFCRVDIVKALLQSHAELELENKSGATALESVAGPFESVEGIYDYFSKALAPIGLVLDKDQIKKSRPLIAEMLIEAGAK